MQSKLSPDPPARSEREWVAGVRRGDEASFAAMFLAFYNRLCVYAECYVHSPDTAEEIVESLFVRIWERHAEWEVHESLHRYLYAAVRNGSLQHLRDRRTRERVHGIAVRFSVPPGMGEPTASAEDEVHAEQLARVVDRTIAQLPDRAREAFLLYRQHGLAHADIAQVMGISVSTVEKHVGRAARALRDAVETLMR